MKNNRATENNLYDKTVQINVQSYYFVTTDGVKKEKPAAGFSFFLNVPH
ncbi:hypothetical protein [Sporomusa termitida]|nr:hypothetical protein [Sporomusa termitida]